MTAATEPSGARGRRSVVWTAGLVLLFFVVIALAVTGYLQSRESFAKVVIEVTPDNSRVIGDIFGHGRQARNDPRFVRTQAQILQTKAILYPVIQDLRLTDEWSSEGDRLPVQRAYRKLWRMMEVKPVRNTSLIEIGIYSSTPEEAANIANTIAIHYQEMRLTQLQRGWDNELAQLKDQLAGQAKRVEELRLEMIKISQRDRIIDPDPESSASALGTSERNLVAVDRRLNEQHFLVTKLESEYAEIRESTPEDSKERQTQAAKLAIEKRTLAALEDRFKSLEETRIRDAERTADYVKTKRRYLHARAILQSAEDKFSTERLERGVDFEPATIWEKAEASLDPKPMSFRRLWKLVFSKHSG
jgi:uncharacterized protein involved in exopolysaccharide biosynthesis